MNAAIVSVSVNIASYRVVQPHKGRSYAQYLVVYSQGGYKKTVGVWKRCARLFFLSVFLSSFSR